MRVRNMVLLTFAHPHLTAAFFDDAHDPRVGDGGTHCVRCVVDLL